MANVFDAGLVAATISQETLTVLGDKLQKLSLFSSDFSNEVKKPKDTINVAIASDTGSTVVNPVAFTPPPDTTVSKTSVELNHIAQFFGISQSDLALGHRLEQLVRINAQAFADKIWEIAIADVTIANFGAAVSNGSDLAPGEAGLKALWTAVSKASNKGLVLDASGYSELIPTSQEGLNLANGAYGFENGVHYATNWSAGQANLAGFSCSKDAIAIAAAAPAIAPSVAQNFYSQDVVTIESLGLSVYANVYGDVATRQVTASMEVMFGSAVAVTDGTMGLVVTV